MHHEKGSKSTTVPRGSSGDHLDVGIDSWTTKIEKEQLFVDNLSATLRDDKAAIRREQETLGKRRATWRARKKTLNPRDGVGRAELKAQSEELNAQTLRLNDAVEQTGAMHRWLVLRRKKLDTLQEYVRSLRAGSAYTKGEPGMENHPNHECKDKGEAGGGGGATSHHGSKGSSHHNANADITLVITTPGSLSSLHAKAHEYYYHTCTNYHVSSYFSPLVDPYTTSGRIGTNGSRYGQ